MDSWKKGPRDWELLRVSWLDMVGYDGGDDIDQDELGSVEGSKIGLTKTITTTTTKKQEIQDTLPPILP